MNTSELAARLRAASPGTNAAAYWGAFAALMVLAALPFVLLSLTAPSSKAERPIDAARLAGSIASLQAASIPTTSAPMPGVDVAAPISPSTQGGGKPSPNGVPAPSRAPSRAPSAAPAMAAKAGAADFEIQCWPTLTIVPGRSTTIDCNVPVFNGDGSDITLTCRAEGMVCRMSPEKVQTLEDNRTLTAKLTVTAPESAGIGIRKAVAIASGGETGAAVKQADVDVNVPPPFSVSCGSIGAAFAKGSAGRIKCWVSFTEGFSDDVALTIKNPGEVPAELDISALRAAPNQTRAFTVQFDTKQLESRAYTVLIRASSVRYEQEAPAPFQVLPE